MWCAKRCDVFKEKPNRGELQKLPVSIKRDPSLVGKRLGNSASFFKSSGIIALAAQIIQECLLPLLRQGLSKDSKKFSSVMEDFLLVSSLIQRVYNVNKKKISPNLSTDSTGSFMHTSVRKDKDLAFRLFIAQDICNTSSMWSHSWLFCEAMCCIARRLQSNTDFWKRFIIVGLRTGASLRQRRLLHRKQEENYARYSLLRPLVKKLQIVVWNG